MKGFRFNLENVLNVRRTAENMAQRDFQLAQAALQEEVDRLQRMFDEKTQAFQERHSLTTSGGTASAGLGQIQDFLVGQEILIKRQQAKIQEFETQVERLREILRERAIETKIIEKLKEKRREEYLQERNRREVKEADDQASMRFRFGREDDETGL
ncbi:MAG: flagellar export protein FliJ [Bdellovibrionaceae bacterium]|nr:flagellar export protein FliJ [Pseudobdellovibrionaceae bacterium]